MEWLYKGDMQNQESLKYYKNLQDNNREYKNIQEHTRYYKHIQARTLMLHDVTWWYKFILYYLYKMGIWASTTKSLYKMGALW